MDETSPRDPPQVGTGQRVFLGCLLLPIGGAAVIFAFGGVGAIAGSVFGVGPFASLAAGPAVLVVLVYAALTWFFGAISRRLLAGARGRPVPTLIPPFIGPIVVGALGLLCIPLGIVGLAGGLHTTTRDAIRTLSLGALCLGFVIFRARAAIAKRRAAAAAPPDEGTDG